MSSILHAIQYQHAERYALLMSSRTVNCFISIPDGTRPTWSIVHHSCSAHAKRTLLLAKSARTLFCEPHFTFVQGELYLIIPFR